MSVGVAALVNGNLWVGGSFLGVIGLTAAMTLLGFVNFGNPWLSDLISTTLGAVGCGVWGVLDFMGVVTDTSGGGVLLIAASATLGSIAFTCLGYYRAYESNPERDRTP